MKLIKQLATLIALCATLPGAAFAGTLAEIPLNLRGNVPSNVLFDISVEWPTAITAAYNGKPYLRANQFEGLFDPNLCYTYPVDHFVPVRAVDAATPPTHACGAGQWSGNFLNWATMTGLDAFRYATTGGNRSTDTATETILERTYISGQGNLFPNKTFNPTIGEFVDATPFGVNTTYTMVNAGKGIQMTLTGTETTTNTTTGADTITCTKANSPAYCTSIKLSSDNSSGTCNTWATTGANDGSVATKPIKCTAFGTFSSGATTITTINSCTSTAKNGQNKYVCTGYGVNFSKTTTNTNNVNNTYNVRLEACKVSATFPLRDNCEQYGTVYKPVGELQRNGEKMRFGVFAYYNSTDIDNAVMRSKLKYVGPRKYSGSLGFVANPNKEWSLTDGTFTQNPDSTEATASWGGAVGNSGVINYLNKFGRQSGSYKTYDNFGKMYYESLRYLRKLPPTQAFYQFSSTANNDDFPVITNWYGNDQKDDPIQYSCQKNYIIAMGDQFTHCDKRLPGGSFAAYGPNQCKATANQANDQDSLNNGDSINVTTLTNALGNLETPQLPTLATTGTGAGTAASFYMAGLAHWAAINDIRPPGPTNIDNNVPVVVDGVKTTKGQTVKTFVINVEENAALGVNSQFWYMAKYGGADQYRQTGPRIGEPLDWSKNVNYSSYKADGTVNETFAGAWPKTLLRAGDPASMIASIKEALTAIDGEIGSNSALSQSSGDLRTGDGAFIYRAIFDSEHWAGNVQAYEINADGTLDTTPVWQAASITPLSNNPGARTILSYNDGLLINGNDDTNSNARRGINFNPANFATVLSERQRDFLNRDEFGTVDSQGANRMGYLRGESANEKPNGLQWRERSWVTNSTTFVNRLGDIVNSNPLYVGPPIPNLPGPNYNAFASLVKDRKPIVYVGANDGMLHAFDASKPGTTGATPGQEIFAYIPSAVYSRLSQLTSPGYSHKYYVDGSPVVSEACSGTCASQTDWKTVLVGGLNAGGQGIYALNVTRPENIPSTPAADVVMWEFTDRDDPDLGYTFSKPVIRLMNNGKWAVIFGNGFNSNTTDGKTGNGRAYLYILPIDGPGVGSKWIQDTNYYKIELKSPSEPASATLPLGDPNRNGLASVAAVDRDLDGTTDILYAGDLQGNLWKIDVSSATVGAWLSAFGTKVSPDPLFTANYKDSFNTTIAQSITTGIEASAHPNGGFMVLFGSGSFINTSDNLGPFKVDSMYGIWDKEDAAKTLVTDRSQLQRQKVVDTITQGGDQFLFLSACKPNYTDAAVASNEKPGLCPSDIATTDPRLGWVFDLPDNGERTASETPLLQAGILTFTTLTPSEDPCTGNTIGREYDVDYLTGGMAVSGVFDLNGDAKIDKFDKFDIATLGSETDKPETWIPPSGRKLKGGASDTPLRFLLPRTQGQTNLTTHACADFIPGWGCPSEMAPQRNCARWAEDVVSDESLRDTLTAGGSGLGGMKKCLPGKAGRLTWRQLSK
jgi:type IV pilus assembly protein PilY1